MVSELSAAILRCCSNYNTVQKINCSTSVYCWNNAKTPVHAGVSAPRCTAVAGSAKVRRARRSGTVLTVIATGDSDWTVVQDARAISLRIVILENTDHTFFYYY